MKKDLDILVLCNKKIRERYNSIMGGCEPVVVPAESLAVEKMLHGDIVDAEAADYVARYIGKAQFEQMMAVRDMEGYGDIGALIGLAEQCIVLGIMFERERLLLLRVGEAEAKTRDYEDGYAQHLRAA